MKEYPYQNLWEEAKLHQLELAIATGENPEGKRAALEMAGFSQTDLARAKVRGNMTNAEIHPDMTEAEEAYSVSPDLGCLHYTPKHTQD